MQQYKQEISPHANVCGLLLDKKFQLFFKSFYSFAFKQTNADSSNYPRAKIEHSKNSNQNIYVFRAPMVLLLIV
jgi:hypothetical protein